GGVDRDSDRLALEGQLAGRRGHHRRHYLALLGDGGRVSDEEVRQACADADGAGALHELSAIDLARVELADELLKLCSRIGHWNLSFVLLPDRDVVAPGCNLHSVGAARRRMERAPP